jgi:integrase
MRTGIYQVTNGERVMGWKWKETGYRGVRYQEHPTRKHGVAPDRYYAIRYQKDGKRREEGLGWASEGMTLTRAVAILAKLRDAAATGEGPARLAEKRKEAEARRKAEEEAREKARRESLTFGAFFRATYYPHATASKKPHSYETEKLIFDLWLAPDLEDVTLAGLSPFHVEKVKRRMQRAGKSPRYQQYALAVVRQVWNEARRLGAVSGENPASKVKTPRVDNRRLRHLTGEEAARLLPALRAKSPDVHDMALLSLHTGLRQGEIFSLTWGDVDLPKGLLTVRDTKNGRTRHACMTAEVKAMLSRRERGAPDALVFPARDGGRRKEMTPTFDHVVRDLGLNAGVADPRDKVVFHTLRHTFASWLVMKGVDLYTVKELLGHSTITMTQRYAHLAPDALHRAVKTLEGTISDPAGATGAETARGRKGA